MYAAGYFHFGEINIAVFNRYDNGGTLHKEVCLQIRLQDFLNPGDLLQNPR